MATETTFEMATVNPPGHARTYHQDGWEVMRGEVFHKHYWKRVSEPLTLRQFKARGFQTRGVRPTQDRLLHLSIRLQHNMVIYDSFLASELREFCRQRGIRLTSRTTKMAIIQELEEADALFEKFLNLPPELREMVCSFYLNDLDMKMQNRKWISPPPPPLASVSKLVRKELLPLFYDRRELQIDLSFDNWLLDASYNATCSVFEDNASYILTNSARLFHYRKLILTARHDQEGLEQSSVTWRIKFEANRKAFSVSRDRTEGTGVAVAVGEVWERMEAVLKWELEDKAKQPGGLQWQQDDPKKLLDHWQRAVSKLQPSF